MEIFMFVPGTSGDSNTVGQKGRIVISSCDESFGRPLDPVTGLPTGSPIPGALVITKAIDSSSAFLANAASQNLAIADSPFIVFIKDFVGGSQEVVRLTLSSAKVEEYTIACSEGGGVPNESVRFSYVQLGVKTSKRDPSGNLLSTSSYTFKPI
jgi:type VI protein secretion system component Hcp